MNTRNITITNRIEKLLATATLTLILSAPQIISAGEGGEPIRVWVATNGNTMEGQLVSKTTSTITIYRKSDGQLFEIPLEKFSPEDIKYVEASKVKTQREITQASLKASFLKFPKLAPIGPLKNDVDAFKVIYKSYHTEFSRMINPQDLIIQIRMAKMSIKRDRDNYTRIYNNSKKNIPNGLNANSVIAAGESKWKEPLVAKSILVWLDSVDKYIVEELGIIVP